MSFGFSVSDFMGLARMACKLYAESHEALANCEAFRRELYLFSETLVKTALLLRYNAPNDAVLVESDKATLTACAQSCKELIYGQICGAANVPLDDDMIATGSHGISDLRIRPPSSQDGHSRYLRSWRLKRADRKFAAKIPKFQQAIFAHSQTLTALHTLIIFSNQSSVLASHDMLQLRQLRTMQQLSKANSSAEDSHTRLEAASERLEAAQSRMEQQLQTILASQQQCESRIMSQSLDASSPEGRETWMNLGRLLRAEGITPTLINQNRDVLIKVMRNTLQGDSSSSVPESYVTALESFSQANSYSKSTARSQQPSADVLGSAPCRGATFSDVFLERHKGVVQPFDQQENVDGGMQSLLQVMEAIEVESDAKDEYEVGEVNIEEL